MSIFNELKRRNVFKVVIAYVVVAWLVMQVSDVVLNNITAPDWVFQVLMLFLAIGFPFAVIFAWAFEMTPEGLKRESDVDRSQSITPQTGKKLNVTVTVIMALAIVYFAYDKFVLSRSPTGALGEATSWLASDSEQDYPTIAVLPFVNISSDPEQEYFSDGISEEILNVLAQVKGLRVAGRTSSFAFKGRNEDLRQIGDALGVEHILEGSVRRSGDQIRITAQLIQVKDGFHLWSETYDRQFVDIFVIQDEISAAILQQLKAQLLDGQSIAVARTDTTAFDLYLQARQGMRERTETSILAAVELLDKAIASDASFAPAWAQRGIASILLNEDVTGYGSVPVEQAASQGKRHLDEALRLDPQLAEAISGIGLYHHVQNEFQESISYQKQALAINPTLIDALQWLDLAYWQLGHIRDSLEVSEEIHLRDPMYLPGIGSLALKYSILGRDEEVIALLESIVPMFPEEVHDQLWANAWFAMSQQQLISTMERLYAAQPANNLNRLKLGYYQNSIDNPERTLEVAPDLPPAILALDKLGRTEEAILLGYSMAAEGQAIPELIKVLHDNQRYRELIEFIDQRWPDLDAFEADMPVLRQGMGADALGHIAHAHFELGQTLRYGVAMWHFKAVLDEQLEEGVDNPSFWGSQAFFALLTGDESKTMSFFAAMADKGMGFLMPKTLINDPRYLEIVAQMQDNLNKQRAELGLVPVDN